ncbi:MAG TPA: hypothetical protein VIJ41_02670 [Candidatus Nanopelagicales bacterium]
MRARTWIATTAVSALALTTALVGVAAVGPANAAVTTQPAGVSVTVDSTGSNTAFVSSAVVANLTVRDNAASATIGAFTVVVPAGVVGPVKVVGVDHGWGYTTLPCAGRANCSAIVLAYASLPLSSSILRPGQAVTIGFSFRTPATPTSLPFKFLGIGNGLFTATSTPTINVINGVAGSFCVSPIVGPLTAGNSRAFTVQAVTDGLGCANVATKKTGITATDATVKFSTPDIHGGIVATTPSVTAVVPGTGSTVVFHLPTSSTGLYAFSGTFDTATPAQSIVVSTGTAAGNNDPFVVNPDVPWDVQVLGVLDKSSQTTTLSTGAVFVTRYAVFDHLGNFINTPSSAVTIAVTGGTFTRSGGADPVANPAADGTVEGAFPGPPGAQLLTAKVGARTSNDFPVTFAAFSTGTVTLFPGVPAIVTTPACDPSAPNTTCAESGLGNGANGTVTFGILSCTGVTVGVCTRSKGGNNLVDLEANFKHTVDGVPDVWLYTATSPANITLHCTELNCPEYNDGDATYVRNSQDAKVDDFEHYQPVAQLVKEPALAPVPSCQPGNEGNEYGDPIPAFPSPQFPSVPAGRRVCVDQTSFVRDSSGNLSATLYFYEDFKGSMG